MIREFSLPTASSYIVSTDQICFRGLSTKPRGVLGYTVEPCPFESTATCSIAPEEKVTIVFKLSRDHTRVERAGPDRRLSDSIYPPIFLARAL
jgi:hypothetical protein